MVTVQEGRQAWSLSRRMSELCHVFEASYSRLNAKILLKVECEDAIEGNDDDDFFRGLRLLVGGIAGGHLVDEVAHALLLSNKLLGFRLPRVLRAVLPFGSALDFCFKLVGSPFLLGAADPSRYLWLCLRHCS